MQTFDIVVLGGGMVGLALTRALKDSQLNIAVVEPYLPLSLSENRDYALRVSAISPSSQQFLQQLGAWTFIEEQRLQPYQKMYVWEKDSFAKIDFDCHQLMKSELGYIIENDVIRDGLWKEVQTQTNVTVIDEKCVQLERGQHEAWLRFERFGMTSARLIVGADGANSWVREQCHVPLTFWDYQHHALVASVRCEKPHENCARQIFTPEGPLAFLPLPEANLCSIVWSVPKSKAEQLQAMPREQFNHQLTMSFASQLGLCHRESEVQSYALRMRYARHFAGDRFALIGDAAHTIHPLAGQGVNLGLADARSLANTLLELADHGRDLGEYRQLREWERQRKGDAALMIGSMEFFKQLFGGANPAKKLFRGIGMTVTDQFPFLKQRWMKQAMGLNL